MEQSQKIDQLQSIIYDSIDPLITNDYVLWDLPYHDNIGDILIWKGELDYLKRINHKCIDAGCFWRNKKITNDAVILLHGGGNWGDLYRGHQDFRLNIIEEYPHNRIIVFPQSVWYDKEEQIIKDASILSRHKDLWICARDRYSYNLMKKHFGSVNILLVPDMAFCIDRKIFMKCEYKTKGKGLYLRRLDKEFDLKSELHIGDNFEVRDWPTLEQNNYSLYLINGIERLIRKSHIESVQSCLIGLYNMLSYRLLLCRLPLIGANFLSSYSDVVTTRLHVLILSVLLEKDVAYIDNTSRKLSAFVDTWLYDLDSVEEFKLSN